jgi:hypothetical protein
MCLLVIAMIELLGSEFDAVRPLERLESDPWRFSTSDLQCTPVQ